MEGALIALRFAQYLGVATLFGASLFCLYALPASGPAAAAALGWPRRWLRFAALLTLIGAGGGMVAQTAVMAGSLAEALKSESLRFVALDTTIGRAAVPSGASTGTGAPLPVGPLLLPMNDTARA